MIQVNVLIGDEEHTFRYRSQTTSEMVDGDMFMSFIDNEGRGVISYPRANVVSVTTPSDITRTRVVVEFSSRNAAGSALSWATSNLFAINEQIRQARRSRDTEYLRNLRTEQAGQIALLQALKDADIQRFDGHEVGA
jgi:hypothetical protein